MFAQCVWSGLGGSVLCCFRFGSWLAGLLVVVLCRVVGSIAPSKGRLSDLKRRAGEVASETLRVDHSELT